MPFWIPGVPNPVFSPAALPFRPTLSTSTLIYVRTDGNDNNSGFANSASGAKATWNNAYTTAAAFDFNNHTVTLFNGNSGSYPVGLGMFTPWIGGGSLVVDLNGGAISALSTSSPNKAILSQMSIPTSVTVQNGTLASQLNSGLQNSGLGNLQLGTGINFGTCGEYAMEAAVSGAQISASGAIYTSNGTGGSGHVAALFGGTVFLVGSTATFSANATYSVGFAVGLALGLMIPSFATFTTGAFTITGKRFSITENAVIETGGTNSATFFPGNAAGTTASGGQYT